MPEKEESQKLEWNIAKERVKKIAQVLSKLRDAYEQARHKRRKREVKAYYTYLNSLYMELYQYLPPELNDEDKWGAKQIGEELDSLEKVMVKGGNTRIPLKHFKKLEEIDRQLNSRRKEMNLDIPVSKDTDRGTEFFN